MSTLGVSEALAANQGCGRSQGAMFEPAANNDVGAPPRVLERADLPTRAERIYRAGQRQSRLTIACTQHARRRAAGYTSYRQTLRDTIASWHITTFENPHYDPAG